MGKRGYTAEQLAKTQKRISSKEMARAYQAKSVISRKKNKAYREALLGIPEIVLRKAAENGLKKGDYKWAELLIKLNGEMPADKLEQNISQTVTVKDDWRKIAEDLGIKTGE